jgi:hypothetical protein
MQQQQQQQMLTIPTSEYLNDFPSMTDLDFPTLMANSRGNPNDTIEVIALSGEDGYHQFAADMYPSAMTPDSDYYQLSARSNNAFPHQQVANLRADAPQSAPASGLKNGSNVYLNGSSVSSSPMTPSTPSDHPHPLTNAQKLALASLPPSLSASGGMSPNSALSATLGVDTSRMSAEELRQLAAQMQPVSATTAAEIRRQMHIQCEQKRRSQIKGGFEALKAQLPGYKHKKLSKAMILVKSIEFMETIRHDYQVLVQECERLRNENAHLKSQTGM